MKKTIIASVLAAHLMLAPAAFAQSGLSVDAIRFYGAQNQKIYTTSEEEVTLTALISNTAAEEKNGVLIAAVYKEDDMSLVSVKTKAVENVGGGGSVQVSENVSLPGMSGYVLKAFVWDSEENGISLSQTYGIYDRMIVPQSPEGLEQTAADYGSVEFSWLAPEHNINIKNYKIYVNGEEKGSAAENKFKLDKLDYGTGYDIQIETVDEAGSVSEKSETFTARTKSAAYMILGEKNEYKLIDRDIPTSEFFDGGFYSEAVEAGPADDRRMCRKIQFIKPYNGNPNGAANYLMFAVNDEYIYKNDNEVTIKLTCLDEGTDTIAVEYSSPGNSYKKMALNKTNTGKWKTFVFKLTDAEFDNKQIGSTYDFRVSTGESNTTEYINKVEIFKGLVD